MIGRLALAVLLVAAVACPSIAGEAKAENSLDAITQRLTGARLQSVAIDKHEPDKALDLIRDAAKVNIVLSTEARKLTDGKTVTLKLQNVSALSALHHVLRQLELVASYGEEALVLTTAEAAKPHPQITLYDIRDLTEAGRAFRTPSIVMGAEVDPLYYYWIRTQLGPVSGTGAHRDPFWELELVDTYPPDHIGETIAAAIEKDLRAKDLGVTVTYDDGYLVVIHQPKTPRYPAPAK
jgi:hypothetical protein